MEDRRWMMENNVPSQSNGCRWSVLPVMEMRSQKKIAANATVGAGCWNGGGVRGMIVRGMWEGKL